MVIQQSLGDASKLLDDEFKDRAKIEIQKLEHRDPAVRTAVLNLVGTSTKPTLEKKREEALVQVKKDNESFGAAVDLKLIQLLRRFS